MDNNLVLVPPPSGSMTETINERRVLADALIRITRMPQVLGDRLTVAEAAVSLARAALYQLDIVDESQTNESQHTNGTEDAHVQ